MCQSWTADQRPCGWDLCQAAHSTWCYRGGEESEPLFGCSGGENLKKKKNSHGRLSVAITHTCCSHFLHSLYSCFQKHCFPLKLGEDLFFWRSACPKINKCFKRCVPFSNVCNKVGQFRQKHLVIKVVKLFRVTRLIHVC